ncbi:MAG: hypothetical protein Q7S08_03325 [bacterium]|nr:hypothetical protein [bacterium]
MTGIEIIPTNTCPPDFSELSRRSEVFAAFASVMQLDLDDGIFAPEISWPYRKSQWEEIEAMAKAGRKLPFSEQLKYEAHLMVQDPLRIGGFLARMNCTRIISHIEVFENARSVQESFASWKNAGATECGLAILIDTPLSVLNACVADCDVVQFMSIASLGKQGAPFDIRVIGRISELHTRNPKLSISVDGGVAESNIVELVRAGARRFGVGSAISKATDPAAAYAKLKALAESAIV